MSSLTINQEKQLRRLRQGRPLQFGIKDGAIAQVKLEQYEQLAGHVREYRTLEKKWGEKATARREVLLKEIDLCLAALEEK